MFTIDRGLLPGKQSAVFTTDKIIIINTTVGVYTFSYDTKIAEIVNLGLCGAGMTDGNAERESVAGGIRIQFHHVFIRAGRHYDGYRCKWEKSDFHNFDF